MLSYLQDTSGSKIIYILRTATLTFGGAMLVGVLHYLLIYAWIGFDSSLIVTDSGPDFGTETLYGLIFLVVIFSPLAETLVMWPILALLKRLMSSYWAIAFVSALIWAGLHSLAWMPWGLYIFWPFLLMSLAFLHWQRVSDTHAYWMTCLIHMVHNGAAVALMVTAS